ncbi:hypothetical protein [Haloferax sp. CBA1150]|uniref:hypothetical protein n=1 Tax=Haloferax sp. CBA1150 TaxID=2650754 RepID=UPI001CD9EA5F|nr:hypothetical protein [Haloferax sp. CBA1150]
MSSDSLQTAEMLARQASVEGITAKHGDDTVAAAALLLAVNQSGGWYTAKDIVNAWREGGASSGLDENFSLNSVLRAEKVLAREISIENEPTKPEDIVERYGEELGTSDEIVEQTKQLLTDVRTEDPSVIDRWRSPADIAASALYLVVYLNDLRLEYTQGDIAETVGVTEVTIRNAYQDIANALGGKQSLASSGKYAVESEENGEETNTQDTAEQVVDNGQNDEVEKEASKADPSTPNSSSEHAREDSSTSTVQLPRPLVDTIGVLIDQGDLDATSKSTFVEDCVRDVVTEHLRSDKRSLSPVEKPSSEDLVSLTIDSMLADMIDALTSQYEVFENRSELVESILRPRVESVAEPMSVSVTFPSDVSLELKRRVQNEDAYKDESELVRNLVIESVRTALLAEASEDEARDSEQ